MGSTEDEVHQRWEKRHVEAVDGRQTRQKAVCHAYNRNSIDNLEAVDGRQTRQKAVLHACSRNSIDNLQSSIVSITTTMAIRLCIHVTISVIARSGSMLFSMFNLSFQRH